MKKIKPQAIKLIKPNFFQGIFFKKAVFTKKKVFLVSLHNQLF